MLSRYYNISSKIHNMNSLAKIICVLLFAIMLFLSFDIKYNVVLTILLILMLLNTKVPIKMYLKTVFSIKYLLMFIFIINLILKNDIYETIIIALRLIYIVLYTSILTFTTSPSEITYGLEQFLSPLKLFKLPISKMALSIALALRFIPNIIEQGNRILKAQASRGVDYYNSKFKDKLKSIKSLIIPIFILSIKRSDDLADCMELRLYDINKKRTNYRTNSWKLYDTIILLIHLLIVIEGVML